MRCWYILILTPVLGYSQKIENWKAALQEDKILITYDLVQGYPGDKYNVSIYASYNNFSTPLQQVSGDVGRGIGAGRGKQIIWNGKNELKGFKGDLTFEIRAEVVAILALTNTPTSAKRGKSTEVKWRGGPAGSDITIELVKGGTASLVGRSQNTGDYTWTVPARQKTGSGYQLKLTAGSETVLSPPFSIKHKIPTVIKASVGAIVLLAILSSGSKSNSTTPTAAKDLPAPPDLGLN